MEVTIDEFLTLTSDEVECLDSRPGRFIPKEEPPLPIGYESLWVPERVRTLASSLALAGNRKLVALPSRP
jgi:hypothetical protein